MADTKITALAAIATVDPAADVLPIVDISDTSMAASGTTKKITSNQILGSGGTATLASATITGALTTQGTQVKLANQNAADCTVLIGPDTANATRSGRIGYVTSSIVKNWFLAANWNTAGAFEFTQTTTTGGTTMATTPSFRINADSTFDFLDGAGGTRMTLNSTGLGVGIVPSSFGRFSIQGTAGGAGILGMNTDATQCDIQSYNKPLAINRAGNNITMCEGGGNVGVGVVPAGTGGCLQLKSGITFPATQVASSDANTLDDYEEGTFVPTIIGTAPAGTATYSAQVGRYTKVGRVVQFSIDIAYTAGSGGGYLQVAGLPFQNSNNLAALSTYPINIGLAASYYAVALIGNNSTVIDMQQLPTGGGGDSTVNYDGAGRIILSGTYTV